MTDSPDGPRPDPVRAPAHVHWQVPVTVPRPRCVSCTQPADAQCSVHGYRCASCFVTAETGP